MPVGSLVQWTTLFSPIQRMVNQCPAGSRVPDRDDEWDPVMFLEAQLTTILVDHDTIDDGNAYCRVRLCACGGCRGFVLFLVWDCLDACNLQPTYMVKIGKRVRVYGVSWRHYT